MEHILNFFISNAYAADAAPGAQQGGLIGFLMPFVVLFAMLYFFIWLPQSRRAKAQKNLLDSLAIGDEVITIGGVLGKINKLADQYVILTIGNNVEMTVQKSAVATVLPKGTIKTIQ